MTVKNDPVQCAQEVDDRLCHTGIGKRYLALPELVLQHAL